MTTVFGEDAGLLHNGALIGGCESRAPLTLNLAELVVLTSGFALRDDDEWRRSMMLDLAECHGCDVAGMPRGAL